MYLCWLVKPKSDRELFRHVRRTKPRSIVEIGLTCLDRTRRTIQLAQRVSSCTEIRYAAVDLFDARPNHLPPVALKKTHQLLTALGVSPRLVPGDVLSGLTRAANQMLNTDLLVIATPELADGLDDAWKFVPRMLSADSLTLLARPEGDTITWQRFTSDDVQARAQVAAPRRNLAA